MPSQLHGTAQTYAPRYTSRLQDSVGRQEAAERIARVWPSPHEVWFQLDVPRRNLLRLAANSPSFNVDIAREADAWSLRRLMDALLPDAPAGLAEALKKLGDNAITQRGLNQLIELLKGDGAKVIRHMKFLTANDINTLTVLPDGLRRMRILALVESTGAANLLAAAARVIVKADAADKKLPRLAQRLERAGSAKAMFRMLIEEVGLEVLAPPPISGTHWLKPIDTVPKINNAAIRFKNCLKTRIGWLLSGYGAYYEVVGDEPAIVEIVRDQNNGWFLGEALGHANAALSPQLRQRIVDYLQSQKVALRARQYNDLAMQLARAAGW